VSKILIVDDEPKSVELLKDRLEESGHLVAGVGCFREGAERLSRELFDLLITDVRLPDKSGIDLFEHVQTLQLKIPTIVITAYGTIRDAVRAMRLGAVEYVQKPFELEAMAMLVERVLENARVHDEHSYLLEQVLEGEPEITLVGQSAAMHHVRMLVGKVAGTHSTVLIQGESGTGKELVAQAIHTLSVKRSQPLIKVNCPAIPTTLFESELFGHMKGAFTGAIESRKGKFELAGKGNIFLDEISEVPLETQPKLLRVIEDRAFTRVGGGVEIRVEARIISATNRDLQKMMNEGKFRDDLFYRLNVFPIHMPPLRDRKEDILETALHLLKHISNSCGLRSSGISAEANDALSAYDWPGNVRELRNVLERALVLAGGGVIEIEDLPMELQEGRADFVADDVTDTRDFNIKINRYKRELLLEALRRAEWSKKNAAGEIGLSQRAFSHYVNKYNLNSFRKS
jgi:two-component system response regulator AtoC